MSDLDDSAASAAGRAPSRRSVLKGVAGVGAAGVAATAITGIALPASAATKAKAGASHEAPLTKEEASGEDVVVHLRDAASGEMDIYRGTAHTKLRDRELAARLIRATK
jgi:hypothetical protein